jgi:hypothetical protein
VALIGGGLGAVISVLLRLNATSTRIDSETTRHCLWSSPALIKGSLRVVLGSLFGLAVVWMARADLVPGLPITGGHVAMNNVMLAGALALLAGFRERWARDTVVRAVPGQAKAVSDPATCRFANMRDM